MAFGHLVMGWSGISNTGRMTVSFCPFLTIQSAVRDNVLQLRSVPFEYFVFLFYTARLRMVTDNMAMGNAVS